MVLKLSIIGDKKKMKYYICSVCSCFARLPDTKVFLCRYCGSEKGGELTEREYRGWAK